jgi:hypothetical protein
LLSQLEFELVCTYHWQDYICQGCRFKLPSSLVAVVATPLLVNKIVQVAVSDSSPGCFKRR